MKRADTGQTPDRVRGRGPAKRLAYEKPQIVDRGRLVEVALGGSPGAGDSGSGTFIEDPLG